MKSFRPVLSLLGLLCGLTVGVSTVLAQSGNTTEMSATVWSRSQQFIVTGPNRPTVWSSREVHPKQNPLLKDVIQLTPSELAISCEQVKRSYLNQLDTTDRPGSRIRVSIKPWLPPQANVLISAVRYNDGWRYEMTLPEYIERRKLVRGIVQVLIQEMGNRLNDGDSVQVPMWLREGLTEIMLEREGITLIAEASPIKNNLGTQFVQVDAPTREKVWKDSLSLVREKLKKTPPLSFSDLSVPVDDQIASLGFEHYQHSSHLFVSELLQLPDGPQKLRTYIQDLFRFSHPQFALFDAYRAHFTTPLEVEKWWSVTQVNFLGRQDRARWPEKNALAKLNQILQPQVRIRLDTNSVPISESITLKQLITDVDFEQQRPVLSQIVVQLQRLEWNLPPDLLKLVYDYHILLLNYANKREQLSVPKGKNRAASSTAKPLIKETLKQLEYLEVLRSDFEQIELAEPPVNDPK